MAYLNSLMNNKSIRNGALFSIFSFVNKGFAFLLLIIIANLMTPAEYGYLNLFNTVVIVVGYFIALSSEGYLSVAYFQHGEKGVAKTFSSVFLLSVIISCLYTLFIWLGGSWLSNSLKLPYHILFMSVVICFFTVYNNMFLNVLRIKEKIWKYGLVSCSCALSNFILSIFLIKYCNWSWEGRAFAQAFCIALYGGIGLVYFIFNNYLTSDVQSFIKPLLSWSIPLIPHAATTFIRQGCDRYIIDFYHSIDDVGLFSFALTLVNVITMIGFGFNQSNSIDIYKTLSDENLSKDNKLSRLSRQRRIIMWIYIIATAITVTTMTLVIPALMPKYVDSIGYFVILAVYGFCVCIYLLYTNYLFYYKCTRQIMYITFGSSIFHLTLSLLLTRYSLYYTAMLYGGSQIFIVLLIRKLALNKIKQEIK